MLRGFKSLRKRDGFLLLISACLTVFQTCLDLKLPDYMSEITRLIETDGNKINDLASTGGEMLLCAAGSLCTAFLIAVASSRAASGFSADLRLRLFDKVQSFSMEEIGAFSASSLIACSTDDVAQAQMLMVPGLQIVTKALAVTALAGIKIAGKAWQWSMTTAVAGLILVAIAGICAAIVVPKFKNVNKNRTDTKSSAGGALAAIIPIIQAVMSGLLLAIYWIGAVLINGAAMTEKRTLFSDTVIFSCYAMQIVMAFGMLATALPLLPGSVAAAHRIWKVLDTRLKITDGAGATVRHGMRGEVEFRNVSFRYPDAEGYVLHNISFTAHKGETVAFIGSSGCGKSTVINLVPRFYDATEGEVLVDGVNVRNYAQQELRNRIGYVSQKATLFSGTVKSNIVFGDNGKDMAMEQDMVDAAYTAQASEFVEEREGGYEGFVAQGGPDFSDGQKQCLSIARAICREPEILLLDDSFSELDRCTERSLHNALRRDCAGMTKLITAQQIGTIRNADHIVVLDEGHIAGTGTHEELMKSCEIYHRRMNISDREDGEDQRQTAPGSGCLESAEMGCGRDGKNAKNRINAWKELLYYMREFWPAMFVALLCAVGSTVLVLLGPGQISRMVDTIVAGIAAGIDMDKIKKIGFTLAAFYGCSFFLSMAHRQILATVTMRFAGKMHSDISEKRNRLLMRQDDGTPDDVDTIAQSLNHGIGTMAIAAMTLAGSLIRMLTANWILTIIPVFSLLIGFCLVLLIGKSSGKFVLRQKKCREAVHDHIEETYSGHTIIKAYNGEATARRTFIERNENLCESTFQAQCLSGLMHSLLTFTGNFGYVAVCVVGAVLMMNDRISFGVIVAFMLYIRYFTQSLSRLALAIRALRAAASAGERVRTYVNQAGNRVA